MNIFDKLGRHGAEIARALRLSKYGINANGDIKLDNSTLTVGGVHGNAIILPSGELYDPQRGRNRVVKEGRIRMANSAMAGVSAITAWYLAPFSGNVTPDDDWTAATFKDVATEFKAYTPTSRPPWTVVAASTSAFLTNEPALAASTITFTGTGPYTLYGQGLISIATKSANTGTLYSAARYGSPRSNMNAGDKLGLWYELELKDQADV